VNGIGIFVRADRKKGKEKGREAKKGKKWVSLN
jgi:hypothetical protein